MISVGPNKHGYYKLVPWSKYMRMRDDLPTEVRRVADDGINNDIHPADVWINITRCYITRGYVDAYADPVVDALLELLMDCEPRFPDNWWWPSERDSDITNGREENKLSYVIDELGDRDLYQMEKDGIVYLPSMCDSP